jgi:demethylsterigmatocystin 6-O-methyltransferase
VDSGFSHQAAALLATFPQLSGKLALQDLPQTLAQLPPHPNGIKAVAHDFFQPQPWVLKAHAFYYLRSNLHDWPDIKAIIILKRLITALGPDSQILIDDIVLPDTGVSWEAATIDLTMIASLGSRERTIAEWYALLDTVGLRVLHIHLQASPPGLHHPSYP